MKITSPAFESNKPIPKRYTCQDIDINPPLNISEIPSDTQSMALIVDDPDAPMGTWVHWVVYNMSVIEQIAENTIPGVQGVNDFRKKNYGGPCPPSGVHRYYFKLYALDIILPVKKDISKDELLKVMKGHILEEAELMGTYIKE
ncbi:MAG: YbhB/YbcL family Raf kinase inhibitor-like protein [Candidatus Omnitrophica bacterium]|nr:YbhB/YbcL family Raf kinase inhibitor-like protein [Candidatus Omnitrophota bacterium]